MFGFYLNEFTLKALTGCVCLSCVF